MSGVHHPSNLVNAESFNSYIDFGTENLLLGFMDKTKGPKCTTKRAIKTISCYKSNCSLICNAILNQFMLGEIFVSPKLAELPTCICPF